MGLIKTENEIRLLKKSASISNSCIPLIEKSLKEKEITEQELARRVGKKINSQGATLSFHTLVACGKRSSMVHPKPHATNNVIKGAGYIDFGASYKGYKTDVTVPFVKGKITGKEMKIVGTTIDAYNLAVKNAKAGTKCWTLHKMTDDFLREKGFKMKHSLGHGLGKKVHDSPKVIGVSRKLIAMKNKLSKKKRKKLEKILNYTFQPNMAFTIEPGIYTNNVGCRIENSFIMLKSKRLKALTKSRLIRI